MHWLGYNDAVSWLNEAKTRVFQPTANFENFEIYLYFVTHCTMAIPFILLSPSLFFFIPLARCESHLRR